MDGNPAMAFDGTTGYIQIAPTISVPLVFTIEVWVKLSVFAAKAIFSMRGLGGSGTSVLLAVNNSLLTYSSLGPGASGTKPVVDGQWHHAVYVFTGSTVSFYVDGQADTLSVPFETTASVSPASIGVDANAGWYWSGALDEIAIYPLALTPAQIAAHYAAATGTR